MGKTKDLKNGSKVKAEAKTLKSVKNASVSKPSQSPAVKSKKIAKETASKINGKKEKKVVKAPTPEPSPPSSSSSSDEDSDSGSEVEEVVKTNGNGVKKAEVDADTSGSDSNSSDDGSSNGDSSDEDSDEEMKPADTIKKQTAPADDSSSESSSSDDEEETPVIAKVAKAGKAAVNGAAKVVAKATETSDDSASESGSSSESDNEDGSDGSSSGSDSSEEESDEEEAKPSKKRKAEADVEVSTKKSKVEASSADGPKNLFVGNLSWNIDDEWLYREFEEFGELTGARVVTDKATGRSKGFGYVEFGNAVNAAAALKAKKGTQIDGREANVDFSTPRDTTAPRERANDRATKFGDSKNEPSDTLFCGNLAFGADETMIGEAFGAHGTVVNVRLPTDMETGNPKGFGYVTFDSIEGATAAYDAMMGAEIGGRPVRLDYATPRPDRGDGGGRGGGRGRGGFERGGRGGGRGGGGRGRGGFDRGGRGGSRGGRGGSTNRGGFGDFQGKKQTFA